MNHTYIEVSCVLGKQQQIRTVNLWLNDTHSNRILKMLFFFNYTCTCHWIISWMEGVNVTEYRRDNQTWTIQRYWQHRYSGFLQPVRYSWDIVESSIEHHKPIPFLLFGTQWYTRRRKTKQKHKAIVGIIFCFS